MLNLLTGIHSTAAALNAERIRMDVIAQNIANVNTTRGLDGRPYQRQQVVFETVLREQQLAAGPPHVGPQTVRVAQVKADPQPPRLVHNPGHPDADARGLVAMPNINLYEEMVDLIAATRAFEANLAVVKNARAMAQQTLAIGKR